MPDSVGRVKACTECRQQKVRCDAFKDYTQPCTRCRTAGLPCVISKDFQRRPRQSKAQLQHEIDRLRAQTEAGGAPHDDQTSPSSYGCSPVEQAPQKRRRTNTSTPQQSTRTLDSTSAYSESSPSLRQHILSTLTSQPESRSEASDRKQIGWSEPTVNRTLESVVLESVQIDECYSAFLNHYAPYLDGLFNLDVNPNERYQLSPLLFWTMILVGSRGYEKDLSIYTRLGEPVLNLIFGSCLRPQQPLFVIQAIIIFCNWPLPVDLIYKDPAHTLAGAALGIALQNGLHMVYAREQDFVVKTLQGTTKPAQYDERDRVRDEAVATRTRTWAYCYLVLQSTFIDDGLPPPAPTRCFRRTLVGYDDILCLLPEMAVFRLRLHELQVDTLNQIANAADLEPKGAEPTLNAIIRSSERRVVEISLPQETRIYRMLRKSAQVFILGLVFLAQREPLHEDILRLYRVARELIDDAEAINHEIRNFTFFMPQSLMRVIILTGHILLRVPKSPLGKDLDMADAELAVHKCIDLFSRRCLSNRELHANQAVVFKQLWKSEKAFVRDGQPQNGLRVDMRYRLAYNPVFDSMWWWRMEFGPSANSTSESARQHPQSQKPLEDKAGVPFPSTWSIMPNNGLGSGSEFSTDVQNTMQTTAFPDEAFAQGGSMENIFDGFMNWWDLTAFSTDAFLPDFSRTADPLVLSGPGSQSLFMDPPTMDFAR